MVRFSKFQLVKYFLLQNRFSWKVLSKEQKETVLRANVSWNSSRDDYANPKLYQNGKNYKSKIDRSQFFKGRIVDSVLKKYKPKTVLEIGPGSGFFTELILHSENIQKYCAIDIVDSFLKYLKEAIAADKKAKKVECSFICEDIKNIKADEKYDMIFFLSSLHHIPDREEFLSALLPFCHDDTIIVSMEPVHYFFRILKIIRYLPKFISDKQIYSGNYHNVSTHHFLTLDEYKSFKKFEVVDYNFGFFKKFKIKSSKNFFLKYFSEEIFVALRPKKGVI